MSKAVTVQRVHIELSRVQTWLFAVPRLRAMVGANALLGETLRVALPKLARETGRGWMLAPSNEAYPCADGNDPLKDHDAPAADAKAGILSRDGGHFEAQFASGAEAFSHAAGQLLRSNLPGLRFRVSIDGEPRTKSQVHLSTELPVLAPCEWTGRGLASAIVEQGDEHPAVSLDVAQRHEAARRTEDGTAVDVASLLSETTKLKTLKRAQELKELVGNGYLSLIHADGNGVGSGAGKTDSERATFFHRNRVLLRRAVQKAIDTHCPDSGRAPLIPLMLGGDDLLLVTRAEIALPFVVTLCEELDALQKDCNGFKLTVGVGVVFAKHTIPIHRLHEVAEQLASSAKRRFRGFKDEAAKRSVVDWAVFSSAWVDDPEEVRRRDWLRGAVSHLEGAPGQEWTQVIKWLAHFASSLPLPTGCDLAVLSRQRMAVRAGLRVELALRAGDVPRAVHGTVAFFEAAFWDWLRERDFSQQDAASGDLANGFSFVTPPTGEKKERFRKKQQVWRINDYEQGIKAWLPVLNKPSLLAMWQALGCEVRDLRNDIAHNEPTPDVMNDARTRMQTAALWSNNDTFLSQPLVQAVLKELGKASPDHLLANLLTEVRRRLVVGEAGGAP